MARSLIIPNPGNATIEERKLVSRIGSCETATRCTAIQMLLAGATRELVCINEEQLIERLDQAILDVINIPKKT